MSPRPLEGECVPSRNFPARTFVIADMITNAAEHLMADLRPLLAAEAAAEAPAGGLERADLEQTVWLRLLERLHRHGPPADPQQWLRASVRAEAGRAQWVTERERGYAAPALTDTAPEPLLLRAEQQRTVRAAVRRLPGRCARILSALLSPHDLTYREIAGTLGISQGSLGPERSRCLGCLRRMLAAEVVPPGPRGKVRGKQPADR